MAERRVPPPVPVVRGNLPRHRSEEWDESQGRELPTRRMEWYERSNPTGIMHSVMFPLGREWGPYHEPPPGVKGLTNAEIDQLHYNDPSAGYRSVEPLTDDTRTPLAYGKGGKVIKSEKY